MTTWTATSLPPCPECGGQLADKSGTDDEGPYFAYDCPTCSWHWGENGEPEPLTVATAPWTRDLWAEVERLRIAAQTITAERDYLRQQEHAAVAAWHDLAACEAVVSGDPDPAVEEGEVAVAVLALRHERDHLRAALAEVLDCFTEHGHPGKDCQRTGWIDVEQVTRWRSLLSPSGREGQAGNEEDVDDAG